MSIMWGPALDAEVAYRVEQIRAAAAPRARRRTRRPSRVACQTVAALAAAPNVVPDTVSDGVAGAAPIGVPIGASPARSEPSGRRWALSGSGAWPAAR